MSPLADWLSAPIGAAALATIALVCIGIIRWIGGPDVWAYFWQGMREGWDFYAAAFTPWTWPTRWRAWRARQR